jgi:predicted RNA methylase
LSVFEIALLALTVFTLISIVWSTLTSGISPMPSSKKARQAMLQLVGEIVSETADEIDTGPIFELGSGWGNLLMPLAKEYPQRQIIGYELSIVPWFTTLILKNLLGLKNITVYRKNFLHADLTSASIILCYLYPEGMQDLESKIKSQRGQLKYLISNNFSLPMQQPIKSIQLDDLYQSPIYLYKFRR